MYLHHLLEKTTSLASPLIRWVITEVDEIEFDSLDCDDWDWVGDSWAWSWSGSWMPLDSWLCVCAGALSSMRVFHF